MDDIGGVLGHGAQYPRIEQSEATAAPDNSLYSDDDLDCDLDWWRI